MASARNEMKCYIVNAIVEVVTHVLVFDEARRAFGMPDG